MVNLDKININETSSIVLAYLGDTIWETFIRFYYASIHTNPHLINKKVKFMVNAKKQAQILNEIFLTLPEFYQNIAKRGKNANIKTFPKSCTTMEYRAATAFEALICGLYLGHQINTINDIVKKYCE